MMRSTLLCLAVLLLLAPVGAAHAEQMRTVRATAVRAAPTAKSRRVARLAANETLTVLRRRGRWLQIEHDKTTGWIPRSTAAGADPEASASPDAGEQGCGDRVWCGRNKQGSSMRMVPLVDALRVFEQPGTDQRVLFTVGRKDELTVMGRDNKRHWYLVQSSTGQIGWVPAASVRDRADRPGARLAAAAAVAALPVQQAKAAPAVRERPRSGADKREARARADRVQARVSVGTGVASVGRLLTANQGEDGYLATAQGVAGTVDASARYRVRGPVHVGVDGSYRVLAGISSLRVERSDGSSATTEFLEHQAVIAICAGYQRRVGVQVRAGVGVEAFEVASSSGAADAGASLPRERLTALLVGLELSVPRLWGALSARSRLDVQVGARAQSPGLEDGMAVESAVGVRAQLSAVYPITDPLYVDGSYALHTASTAWSGPSSRDPSLADSRRTDRTHSLTVSLGARF